MLKFSNDIEVPTRRIFFCLPAVVPSEKRGTKAGFHGRNLKESIFLGFGIKIVFKNLHYPIISHIQRL